MDWNIFWEAMSAIATTAAVIVALYQTRVANLKKAKISFVENMTIVPTVPMGVLGYMPKNQYVGVDFVNTGNRKIIIQSFWIEHPDGVKAVINPEQTPIGLLSWPVSVDIEESVFIPWEKVKFLNYLNGEKSLPRNKTITFCVTDSTGVIYRCSTPKTLQQYINESKNLLKKENA